MKQSSTCRARTRITYVFFTLVFYYLKAFGTRLAMNLNQMSFKIRVMYSFHSTNMTYMFLNFTTPVYSLFVIFECWFRRITLFTLLTLEFSYSKMNCVHV